MFEHFKAFIFLSLVLISSNAYALPSNVKVLSDIAYGKEDKQTLDVYIPVGAKDAPVIFMVHGGGWRGGDKARAAEFENKVAHWGTKGFVFISTNYRTLPENRPVGQAKDVVAALLFSQENVREWGGSPEKFILMGHSAGAHLISLVSSNNADVAKSGLTPWLGTVSLDTPYDLVKRMTSPNPPEIYKRVFSENPDYWEKASPFYSLTDKLPPFLAVCSTRSDTLCGQAEHFLEKVESLGSYGEILAVDLSHNEINSELGKENCFTSKVDDFLKKMSPSIESMLTIQGVRTQKNCISD
ncbi:MAG: alpha/beta hydrolase [Pseudomonadota bacterium]